MRFKAVSIAAAMVAGVLMTAAVMRSQPVAVGEVWEYAIVTQTADIENGRNVKDTSLCYATPAGCKSNESASGVNATAARLGEKGWELTSVTESSGERRTLYFKRLRSAIHRNDDRR